MAPHIFDELSSVQDTIFKIPTTDVKSATVVQEERTKNVIGHTLLRVVRRAMASSSVTCGIYESVKLLSSRPDNVMLCLMPQAEKRCDVTVHIQYTLMEAFCWENEIKMLKVDDSKKLAAILGKADTDDVSCVLLEVPADGFSPDEERVADFYNTAMYSGISPNPVIPLP